MKVLVACEYSGRVRDQFLVLGHDAVSCDLLETERPGPHIIGDVRQHLSEGWDLMIAHPPCTYLANSGVRWLHSDASRWPRLFEAADFFLTLMRAPIAQIAIENPVMHKYARRLVGRRPDCTVQPYQHGDPFTKRTCFWLKDLPNLKPTNVVEGREAECHRAPPSEDRWKNRSRTYPGIARAIANQWGGVHA